MGPANCAGYDNFGGCAGTNGFVNVEDAGTNGQATSYNNGIYGQDSWTIGKGVTLDLGIRDEKEFLPGEAQPGPGVPTHPINFGWKDKIAPRLGASWDVFHDGKWKLFGSYGKFYDVMKLNLAISSFGGQYWQNCFYTLSTSLYGGQSGLQQQYAGLRRQLGWFDGYLRWLTCRSVAYGNELHRERQLPRLPDDLRNLQHFGRGRCSGAEALPAA